MTETRPYWKPETDASSTMVILQNSGSTTEYCSEYCKLCRWQEHLMKTANPLRPIVVIKEGQTNKDFEMALAA